MNSSIATNNSTKCTFFALLCQCGATENVGIIGQKCARLAVRTSLGKEQAAIILGSLDDANRIITRLVQTKSFPVPHSSAITISLTRDVRISMTASTSCALLAAKYGIRSWTRWKKNGTVLCLTIYHPLTTPTSTLSGLQKWRHSCTATSCCIISGSTGSAQEIAIRIFASA